jgi:GTP cyclohydrolase I
MEKYFNKKSNEQINQMIDEVAKKYEDIIKIMDLPVPEEHIADTPRRIAKMLIGELFSGCYKEPPQITTFNIKDENRTPVCLTNIQIKSVCSHHFVPFIGTAAIEYFPKDKIVGISKLARIANYFARRPQVQEELTSQIGKYIWDILQPEYVTVVVKAKHLCISHRGANEPRTEMITSWYYDLEGKRFNELRVNKLLDMLK